MTVWFAVKVRPDLFVWHTPAEWAALNSGVDVEASWQAVAPLDPDDDTDPIEEEAA